MWMVQVQWASEHSLESNAQMVFKLLRSIITTDLYLIDKYTQNAWDRIRAIRIIGV